MNSSQLISSSDPGRGVKPRVTYSIQICSPDMGRGDPPRVTYSSQISSPDLGRGDQPRVTYSFQISLYINYLLSVASQSAVPIRAKATRRE